MAAEWAARLARLANRVEDGVLVVLLLAMLVLSGAQIFLRNFFDYGIEWNDALLRLLVLWITLVGAMIASRRGKHIRIDLLPRLLPNRFRPALRRVADLGAAVVCGIIAWHAGRFVAMEMEDGMELIAGLPLWVAEAVIPLGFAVMGLRYLADTFRVGEPSER